MDDSVIRKLEWDNVYHLDVNQFVDLTSEQSYVSVYIPLLLLRRRTIGGRFSMHTAERISW
jgi:hypothetical protein